MSAETKNAIDTVAVNTTSELKKPMKTKTEADGIIYYIIPNTSCVLKSGYIYCNYLMDDNENKDNMNTMREKLMRLYSTNGKDLSIMLSYCSDTKDVFSEFINRCCIEFTDEKTDKSEETSLIEMKKFEFHNNIFKIKQTELKEALKLAANVKGYTLKFINFTEMHKVELVDSSKPITKKTRKTPEKKSKDVKLNKKDDKKEEVKEEVKKEETKKEEVKETTTKSKVPRKTKPIEESDEEADEEADKETKPKVKQTPKVETKPEGAKKVGLKKKQVVEEDFDDIDDIDAVQNAPN